MQKLTINIQEQYLEGVLAMIKQYVPEYEVWAYGSRVTGGAWEASDLDLVVRNPKDLTQTCDKLSELQTAFVNSNLPISVDIMDWARISQSFRDQILRGYVVLQGAV